MSQTTPSALTLRTRRTPALTSKLTWAVLLTAAALTACGGGDDAPVADPDVKPQPEPSPINPAPAPTLLSAAQLQGRWQTASGVTPARTAIVLPGAAAGSTDLWLLASDLSSLARLQVSTTGTDGVSATGKTYSLPSSSSNVGQSFSASGTANLSNSNSNSSLSLNSGALWLTRGDALTSPSTLAEVLGAWRTSVGSAAVTVNLSLAASGALSGSSTTGCSYSGTLAARSDATAYNTTLTETCSTGSVNFAGIATYRAAQTTTAAALTLALTSTDAAQTQALVMGLQR